MSPWSDIFERPAEAKIERLGRWWYRVYVTHGLVQYGPNGYGWHVFGERRALTKARRVLRKYIDDERWRANVQTVAVAEARGSDGSVRDRL